jgi:hypothetical protein
LELIFESCIDNGLDLHQGRTGYKFSFPREALRNISLMQRLCKGL